MTAEQQLRLAAAEGRYDEADRHSTSVVDVLEAMTRESYEKGTPEQVENARHMRRLAEALHAAYANVPLRATEEFGAAADHALGDMTAEEEAYYREKLGDWD